MSWSNRYEVIVFEELFKGFHNRTAWSKGSYVGSKKNLAEWSCPEHSSDDMSHQTKNPYCNFYSLSRWITFECKPFNMRLFLFLFMALVMDMWSFGQTAIVHQENFDSNDRDWNMSTSEVMHYEIRDGVYVLKNTGNVSFPKNRTVRK